MRERVKLIGGEFDIEPSPGTGTTIIARLTTTPVATRFPVDANRES